MPMRQFKLGSQSTLGYGKEKLADLMYDELIKQGSSHEEAARTVHAKYPGASQAITNDIMYYDQLAQGATETEAGKHVMKHSEKAPDPGFKSTGGIIDFTMGGIESVVSPVADFVSDPTGQKKAAESMEEIYQQQMAQQQQQWDDYLRGFEQFGETTPDGQLTPYGQYTQDIRAGEYLPPRPDEYAQWDTPQYQREGGQFQDAPAYGVSPYEQYQDWDPADLADDPGYQFRLQQGTEALERRAAAQGRSLGSAADKELMEFAQGLASQEADKAFGRYTGQHGIRRREREFEEPFAYGVHSGEQARLRGGMESDRGFGLQEYATTTPMQYGMFTGERDFGYTGDLARSQAGFQQMGSPFEFQRQIHAMQNPLGFMGQQGSAFQGLAGAQPGQHRPAFWDWANLGVNVAQAGGNLGWQPLKKGE